MNLRRISVKSVLLIVYSTILLALLILPHYKYSVTYMVIILASAPFVFAYAICDLHILRKIGFIFVWLAIIALLRFMWNTPFYISGAVNTSIILYLCILAYFIFEILMMRDNRREIFWVIVITCFMLALIGFNTFREFASNPTVARLLANGTTEDEYINLLRSKNVGGFGFSYCIGMLTPYIAMRVARAKWKNKIPGILLLGLLLVFIFYTQYTTLLLLSVFFTACAFVTKSNNMIFKITFLIIFAIVLLELKDIFLYLTIHVKLENLASHFNDLYIMMTSGKSSSSRTELYGNAFALFLKNPILGADLTDASNAYIVNHAHSTFFGMLAGGGIVGTGIYYGIFFKVIKNIKSALGDIKDIFPVFIMFFVLSFLNPVSHFEINIVVFMLIPLFEYKYKKG
ncbi:MAG: hypothetical protein J1F23_03345 [Oscillospiraceae bacterium]|nr:hypothetical protein [Oscillospiraceae bacterium]